MNNRPLPTRRLPRQPNLPQLRKQAKDLLDAYRRGDPAAAAEVHRFERAPHPAHFALADAQRVLARAYGFDSWPKLKAFADGVTVRRLASAVKAGDVAQVRRLLTARPELVHLDLAGDDEHRALHYAVLRRDPAMVRLLMQHGADARKGIFPHRDATSAYALARDREYTDIVAILEEEERKRRPADASLDEPASPVEPHPLADAVAQGDAMRVREMVEADRALLATHGGWRRGGVLSLAVARGQLAIVELLLNLGGDPNEPVLVEDLEEPVVSYGQPLWSAVDLGHFDIARLLLERGADPNANLYASGWPLDRAYRNGDLAMKRLLLAHGARPKPWTVALAHDVEAARQMLAVASEEETARELAWSAACNGCPEILELALPHLAWPGDDPRWNWVLIQPPRSAGAESAGEPYFACMRLLLAHGVDPNVSARFGQTPLHFIAARHTLTETVRVRFAGMLLDAGARFDVRDELLRSTPLGWACRWGREDMVELLLARGAPVEEAGADGWATPLAWARKMNHQRIVARLSRKP